LIQDQFTGESLAHELLALLEKDRNAEIRAELASVAKQIGEPGASNRAAAVILEFVNQTRT
jgi:lipid A disaccharide synthetase